MNQLFEQIAIKIADSVYLRNPEHTQLGRDIIRHGIELLDELGLDAFTFRKLAERIGTSEPSIYRYFENKHKLLLYLLSWYWGWLEYRIVMSTANVDNPEVQLKNVIQVIASNEALSTTSSFIDVDALYRLVVEESPKAYLNRRVDDDNKEGTYGVYKRICERISLIILQINPDFKYPHSLASTLIETAQEQQYFQKHIPKLTDLDSSDTSLEEFLFLFTFKTIQCDGRT